jgi:hypothetical protein
MELQASFVARQQFLTLVTLARDLAYIFKLSVSSSLSSLQLFECLLQNSKSISADNGNLLSTLFWHTYPLFALSDHPFHVLGAQFLMNGARYSGEKNPSNRISTA